MNMKTKTKYTYTYDPQARNLTIFEGGKARGGFVGTEAELRFVELLEKDADITITTMNTDLEHTRKIKIFHACLAAAGLMAHKEDIISAYGVTSTKDLTNAQLQELIERYDTSRERKEPASPEVLRLRSELLTICGKMGMPTRTQAEWAVVNRFMLKHTGKLLSKLSIDELKNARKQFNSILDWHKAKQAENERLTRLN